MSFGKYTGTAMPSTYWNTLVDRICWRISKDIPLPWFARTDDQALVYYESPYYVLRIKSDTPHVVSIWSHGYSFGYGTYQWKAKVENPNSKTNIYVGLLERRHGWPFEGAIFVEASAGDYKFTTSEEGLTTPSETTILEGQDWTTEKTFKVEWAETYVKLYVNDSLEATHSGVVPAETMGNLFFEIANWGTTPPDETFLYIKEQSFEQLA